MNSRMMLLGQGNLKMFIREADEVKVFEVFGGDLPVHKANRKPTRKTIGRPIGQSCGGLSQLFICSRMSGRCRQSSVHGQEGYSFDTENVTASYKPVPRIGQASVRRLWEIYR